MTILSLPPPKGIKPPPNSAVTVFTLASFWLWALTSNDVPTIIAIVGSLLIVSVAVLTREW